MGSDINNLKQKIEYSKAEKVLTVEDTPSSATHKDCKNNHTLGSLFFGFCFSFFLPLFFFFLKPILLLVNSLAPSFSTDSPAFFTAPFTMSIFSGLRLHLDKRCKKKLQKLH